jgi:hypothetical protein
MYRDCFDGARLAADRLRANNFSGCGVRTVCRFKSHLATLGLHERHLHGAMGRHELVHRIWVVNHALGFHKWGLQ